MTKVHQAVLSRTKFGDFGGVLAHHVMTSLYLLDPLKLVASHSEKSDPLLTGLKSNEEKKKYFKVERSSTAPSASTWSSDAVKRRKVEHQADEMVRERDLELRHHIRRHRLWDHAVASGTLQREIRDDLSWEGEGSLKAAAWAGGLEAKGEVRFGSNHRISGHLPCLWVGGQEQGLETAVAYTKCRSCANQPGGGLYTAVDEETPVGSYLPVDDDGKLSFREDVPLDSPRRPVRHIESTRCPQMSSITYHEASHRIILTSREPGNRLGLNLFTPPRSRGTEGTWVLGQGIPLASSHLAILHHTDQHGQPQTTSASPSP
ncbi:unnamed protein product, partial [Clonostachys rosea f. rosea IK726]